MAETSAIEWTDSTFNPWIGCTKISPACDHCYAEALMDKRHGRVKWGGERSRTSESNWQQPRRWQKQAAAFFAEHGRRQRVFCSSLADVFDNQVPTEWRDDLWALIRDTPALDWQLLTKRPQNIGKMLPAFWDEVRGHVWLGTTVEDQQRADMNIPHLLRHDAAVRFISVEPMLGPIDLEAARPAENIRVFGFPVVDVLRGCHMHAPYGIRPRSKPGKAKVNWVIAGGESGPEARPSHPDWFRSLRDQCAAAGVPFLFKQWGEWGDTGPIISASGPLFHQFENGAWVQRYGKKANGRLLDNVEHNGFPEASP
ncbi:Bacteriophage protein gp37 [Devosia sp. LC5]|uniref:phage Gp37/Gp68 family protein n=1 Tax=Devosia sp. LC5 TaxID=1502724 RepID=UPI0004E362D2|nr:phage Gp37/Gp68 family protein [Devosia sp. LC5]KFC62738.1 Bacteriophage protein gp37 [Devosia sp. LC5]